MLTVACFFSPPDRAGECYRCAADAGDRSGSECARSSFTLAVGLAMEALPPSHPMRLTATLNLCILLEESLDVRPACVCLITMLSVCSSDTTDQDSQTALALASKSIALAEQDKGLDCVIVFCF
jgi:hypothetical protein